MGAVESKTTQTSGEIVTIFNSRRMGKLLSINLSPIANKTCSFDCSYCCFGNTKIKKMDYSPDETYPLEQVYRELAEGFEGYSEVEFAGINVAGGGEPTIYPFFPDVARRIIQLRDRYFPSLGASVFTNCCNLGNPRIAEALDLFDRKMCKLDAGDERTFRRINRPVRSIRFEDIVGNLAKTENVELSVGVVEGESGNYESLASDAFVSIVKRIVPVKVFLFELDRPAPRRSGVVDMRITKERLLSLADHLRDRLPFEIEAVYNETSRGIHPLIKGRNLYGEN